LLAPSHGFHADQKIGHRCFGASLPALACVLRNSKAGILFNEHIAEDSPVVFAHACRLGAEGIVSKKVDRTYRSGPCCVWIKVRNPASIALQRRGACAFQTIEEREVEPMSLRQRAPDEDRPVSELRAVRR
jgi:hypothetical protein